MRALKETDAARRELIANISHDLRTPLTGLTGAASLLVSETDSLSSAARRELAESILDESDRLNRLVANLLDMTRLEAGAIRLQCVLLQVPIRKSPSPQCLVSWRTNL